MRFEFLEIIVRIAFNKYIVPKVMNDASDAVERLLEDCVLPHMPPLALTDPNEFRFQRMYNEATEAVLEQHHNFLTAIFRVRTLCVSKLCHSAGSWPTVRGIVVRGRATA